MSNHNTSSFGKYEAIRILIPGFYFASLAALFIYSFLLLHISIEIEQGYGLIIFFFLTLVSGLTMYAKETPKRRKAFLENQPSTFVQNMTRKISASQIMDDIEARQLYFYILNNHIPYIFHDKIFFFGTIYHIMIQIRRTSFWFAVVSLVGILIQCASGILLADQQGAITFCIAICFIYLLNVKYNKADRKMQENYQDQIFWLQMNESLINELFEKYESSRKGNLK